MRGYDYYANHVYEQAVIDPDVNEDNSDEVIEYSREIAEMLVIDPDKLQARVRQMEQTRTMTTF